MEAPRRPGPTVRVRVQEYVADGAGAAGRLRRREDRLATEEPLEVRLGWPGHPAQRVAVTMRTPGHDFELATGLCFAEGLLEPVAPASVAYCTDADLNPEQEFNVVTVQLDRPPPRLPAPRPDTVTAAASACGVCGSDSIEDALAVRTGRRPSTVVVDAGVLTRLPAGLRLAQRVFESTGGLHAAGLFDASGVLVVAREDVGRHNAVDKVVGARLLAGAEPAAAMLCVSGRVGFEIVQKAAAAGIGLVVAIGAPSSLAVRLAGDAGIGLVGFLSIERFVVYAGAERVAL